MDRRIVGGVVVAALLLGLGLALQGRRATAAASLNPCAARSLSPSAAADPRAAVAANPCAARVSNPCAPGASNPCAAAGANPCARRSANPCAPGPGKSAAVNPCGPRQAAYRPEIEGLMAEFLSTRRAIEGSREGETHVSFAGTEEDPRWFEALMVTHADNPLLEEECKKQALQISVDALGRARDLRADEAIQAAAEHIRQHQDFVRSDGISYASYLKEISECRAFCGPLVAHLEECHVLSVARSTHGIVLFDLDSDRVAPSYDRSLLADVSRLLAAAPERKVVLIGRASRIGDLRYNRRLAARRALALRDRLIEVDVPKERIETMWFGWEPPQISPWIAEQYGLGRLFEREGPQRMNQSVMLVVY